MGLTDPWGLPFPECDPPLRKDAGDIAQVRDLALAMDAHVTQLYLEASELLIRPDACRMQTFANQTSASPVTSFRPFYDIFNFDNTPGQVMSDPDNGVIQIVEPGVYLCGAWFTTNSAVNQGMRAKFLKDGFTAANPHGTSNIISGTLAYLSISQTLRYQQPGTLATEMSAQSATNWIIQSRMYALQIAKL